VRHFLIDAEKGQGDQSKIFFLFKKIFFEDGKKHFKTFLYL